MRSDLPGYLADSEADGVCVINYYHKQFKHAAKMRSSRQCPTVRGLSDGAVKSGPKLKSVINTIISIVEKLK